jgi:hypothetical protein
MLIYFVDIVQFFCTQHHWSKIRLDNASIVSKSEAGIQEEFWGKNFEYYVPFKTRVGVFYQI